MITQQPLLDNGLSRHNAHHFNHVSPVILHSPYTFTIYTLELLHPRPCEMADSASKIFSHIHRQMPLDCHIGQYRSFLPPTTSPYRGIYPTLLQYAPHYRPSTLSHVLAMAKSIKYTRNLRVITKLAQSANPCCALLYASHAYCNNHTTTQLRTLLVTTPPDLFTIEQDSQTSATSSTISLIQHSPTLFKR